MSWIAPPTEPFQSESVNRADFQYRQGERQQPIRPKNEIERAEGPFNGESSSRDAYKAWQAQPRYRHQQPAYERPEGSMDLRTTYSNEFANSGPRVRLPPIRPESQHRQLRDPNAAFAGHSEQAESFPGYKRAQISDAKPASFKPNRQYQPPEVPFAARSSYAGDFATTAPGSERARPVRHSDQLQVSTEPMVNRGAGSNAEYGAAAGVGGAVAAKRQPIVPRGELSIPAGAFAAETTQRGDFAPQTSRQQSRREPIRHAGELQLNSGTAEPFSARTVAQQDFEARRGERPAPVRPKGELELSREPMAAATTNRDVFTPKSRDEPAPTRRRPQPQQLQQQQVAAS
ncbi:hypothetical protein BOX15_Mlig016642g1 [Macrostomum lignano]|uniref:Uncharacterized protein n=1 Tax=Macrostomum lignano TaxID=282301 RepID=A0A267DPW8_9PLAT|nr:hypothetical protein BOX15_Mlig016642g1 [Macrostomum lignano]